MINIHSLAVRLTAIVAVMVLCVASFNAFMASKSAYNAKLNAISQELEQVAHITAELKRNGYDIPEALLAKIVSSKKPIAILHGDSQQEAGLSRQGDIVTFTQPLSSGRAITASTSINEVTSARTEMFFSFWLRGLVGGTIIVLFVGLSTRKIIYRKTKRAKNLLTEAANHSDLSIRLDESGKDEISLLGQAFNIFADTTERSIKQVDESSATLAGSADNMRGIVEQTQDVVDQQKHQIEQVAAAIEEMSSSTQEIAAGAQNAAQASYAANTEAAKGKEVVHQSTSQIRVLADEMSGISAAISA